MSATAIKIGVALSSGGAAGMAHVGVLEELLAAGIHIDCVAGTSAGAMAGAAYAANDLSGFRDTMCALTRRRVLALFDPIWPRAGLLEGRRPLDLIRPHVGERIETLSRPYAAVAADLHSGAEVVLRRGNVLEAIRASAAVPGLFTPQHLDGRLLADGGLVNPLPVDVARQLGAQFVIAVSVLELTDDSLRTPRERQGLTRQLLTRFLDRLNGSAATGDRSTTAAARRRDQGDTDLGLIDVISRATAVVQQQLAVSRLHEHPPDFLITVPVSDIGLFDFHRATDAVAAGRVAVQQALPALRTALEAATPLSHRVSRWLDDTRGRHPRRMR